MTVVTNHLFQKMVVMLNVLVHIVLLFAPSDGDLEEDGESNAKQITRGHIQNSLHASLVLTSPVNLLKLMQSHRRFS